VEYKAINIGVLQQLSEALNLDVIDMQTLVKAGFVSGKDKVKILGKGNLTAKLTVKAHAFSKSAKDAIEKSEGTTEIL
jgi:large subunit ribosomal protein L15